MTDGVFTEHSFDRPLDKFWNEPELRESVLAEQKRTIDGAVLILHGAIIDHTPRGTSHLLVNSILPEVRFHPDAIIGAVQTSSPYARPVEFGAKPHWIPIGPLKLWAKRVLGNEHAAFWIRLKHAPAGAPLEIKSRSGKVRILRGKGIRLPARHMFEKGFTEKEPVINKMFDDMLDRIVKRWAKS